MAQMGGGIYDLNGWGHLWLKWVGQRVIVYGRYAKKKTLIFRGVPFLVIA